MLWTDAHIEVYFFPRNSIPSDITNKAPTPDKGGWGQPVARYACFFDQRLGGKRLQD